MNPRHSKERSQVDCYMVTSAIREKGKDAQEEGTFGENILLIANIWLLVHYFFYTQQKKREKQRSSYQRLVLLLPFS